MILFRTDIHAPMVMSGMQGNKEQLGLGVLLRETSTLKLVCTGVQSSSSESRSELLPQSDSTEQLSGP